MGFLTIVRKIKRKEREIRILVLGLDNAGKTTILYSLLGLSPNKVSPTLGFQIQTILKYDFKINVWDVGGQSSLRPFWRHYYEETDGLIWVIDATDIERLIEGKSMLEQVLQAQRLQGAPLLLFLNKMDLNGAMSVDEVKHFIHIDNIEKNKGHKCLLQSCSAYLNQGIEEGFQWIVNEIQQRIYPNSINKL